MSIVIAKVVMIAVIAAVGVIASTETGSSRGLRNWWRA